MAQFLNKKRYLRLCRPILQFRVVYWVFQTSYTVKWQYCFVGPFMQRHL